MSTAKRTDAFETRQYQVELIEKIKTQNTILFLPTGSGKTFIALEVIKYMQKDLRKPVREGGKRTIILANQRELVDQHYEFLQRNSSLKITSLTGADNVDLWEREKWLEIENNAQVLILTSQIYVNCLTHGYLYLKNANLLIFDECHHARKRHAMKEVMLFFQKCDEKDHPKVLGLTATLLNANTTVLQFNSALEELESTFRSKIITSTRISEVKKFSTKPEEKHKFLPAYEPPSAIIEQISPLISKYINIFDCLRLKEDMEFLSNADDKLLNDRGKNRAKLLKNSLNDILIHLQKFGLYYCFVCCTSYLIQAYKLMFAKANEEKYCNALLLLINVLKAVRKILFQNINKFGPINKTETMLKTSCAEFAYVLNNLRSIKTEDKCIIFVERRMTAKILYKMIELFFEETKSPSKVDFMIGFSIHPLKNSREPEFETKCLKTVMNKFRSGQINVLVASNVLEEGIDLPDCNIIIMHDFPKTFRSYVQSKGRARKEKSSYVLLMTGIEYSKKIEEFKKIEGELENVVQKYEIFDSNSDDEETENEEFYSTNAGATITKTQSIPLINLYCSTLPHDIFTTLTPYWWVQKVEKGVICKLQFPINAAIRNLVVGPLCSNTKEAKQAVAFEAVKLLHQKGALNDKLMPILVPFQIDEDEWFPHWDKNYKFQNCTKNQKHEVDMKIPKYLIRPEPCVPSYLHVINIIPKYTTPKLNRRLACHKLLSMKYELGIITKNRLPPIADFPVYSDLGEVRINISTNCKVMTFNEKQIKDISKFHRILFLKALQIVKKCLYYANDNTNSYFVVPLTSNKSEEIDIAWRVILEQCNFREIIAPSSKERETEEYTKRDFWGSVIAPWYRKHSNKIQYYVVTQVNAELTIESEFPSPRFATFAEYYKKVYDLEALRPCQPLMEVRPITHNLDGIRPKATTSDKNENKKKQNNNNIYVAPEFCVKQDFPACYWYKATVLPSVLHRITYLLLAEEMREKIAIEAEIGLVQRDKDDGDLLECAQKHELKKKTLTTEQTAKKSQLHISSMSNKSRYSRRVQKFEQLVELMGNEVPLDLDRNKNVGVKDVEKFVSLMLKKLEPHSQRIDGESSVSHSSSDVIMRTNKPIQPPNLATLKVIPSYKGPRQHEILEALTPKACHDIVDLERLETLGDSFLKFAVSFAIFVKCKEANEGHMTCLKGRLVGNRNLMYCGNQLNLASYLKMNRFSAYETWCPPGFIVPEELSKGIRKFTSPVALFDLNIPFHEQYSGNISPQTVLRMKEDVVKFIDNKTDKEETKKKESVALLHINKQYVFEKTIADAMEALIGVYVKTGGLKPGFQLLKYFGILSNSSYKEIMESQAPTPLLPKAKLYIDDLIPNYEALEKKLTYKFRDKSYIVQALSHPSYLRNNVTNCYQTLEFIGDAALDFLITSYIFEYCGDLPPGKLTDLRSSLVNNNTFGALAVRLGLHKFLLSNSKKLTDAMNFFIAYQEQKNHAIYGNELMILISDIDVKIAEEVEIPKVLGDIFESIAGAIFLDSGNNLQEVWRVYYNIMRHEIKQFSETIPLNPLRALYEEPGLKIKFLKPIEKERDDEKLQKFLGSKITLPLRVLKDEKEYVFYGRGDNLDLCKRAAAKLALRDLGMNAFVI